MGLRLRSLQGLMTNGTGCFPMVRPSISYSNPATELFETVRFTKSNYIVFQSTFIPTLSISTVFSVPAVDGLNVQPYCKPQQNWCWPLCSLCTHQPSIPATVFLHTHCPPPVSSTFGPINRPPPHSSVTSDYVGFRSQQHSFPHLSSTASITDSRRQQPPSTKLIVYKLPHRPSILAVVFITRTAHRLARHIPTLTAVCPALFLYRHPQ